MVREIRKIRIVRRPIPSNAARMRPSGTRLRALEPLNHATLEPVWRIFPAPLSGHPDTHVPEQQAVIPVLDTSAIAKLRQWHRTQCYCCNTAIVPATNFPHESSVIRFRSEQNFLRHWSHSRDASAMLHAFPTNAMISGVDARCAG